MTTASSPGIPAEQAGYVGRFAPTPSGPLHAGSLVAALGSWVEARANGGRWLLRIDDLDTLRVDADALDAIPSTLAVHGLHWDGPVHFQSTRRALYNDALAHLQRSDRLYRCRCSRRELRRLARYGPLGLIYPGTCRYRSLTEDTAHAVRLALPAQPLTITDPGYGTTAFSPGQHIGDVVVRRRDGLPAYHLVTTVDDGDLGVTNVVRGVDLLAAGSIQNHIQTCLEQPAVRWRHLPLTLAADGSKLSKSSGAEPLDATRPIANLLRTWHHLGQTPPQDTPATPEEFLTWATRAWSPERIPFATPSPVWGRRPE